MADFAYLGSTEGSCLWLILPTWVAQKDQLMADFAYLGSTEGSAYG
jgi:hypothetical protein